MAIDAIATAVAVANTPTAGIVGCSASQATFFLVQLNRCRSANTVIIADISSSAAIPAPPQRLIAPDTGADCTQFKTGPECQTSWAASTRKRKITAGPAITVSQ